jgi:hypothetical protein
MSKAQEVYARVEELANEGLSKREAHEKVAEERGDLRASSVRGLCTIARRELGLVKGRVRETTTEGAVASAVETLERARDAIDEEVSSAKERASEAVKEAKELAASAEAKKAEIEAKIEALTS